MHRAHAGLRQTVQHAAVAGAREEIPHRLGNLRADAADLLQLRFARLEQRLEGPVVVREQAGHRVPDVLDAQREQEAVEARPLALLDRVHQVLDRFFGEALEAGQIDRRELVEIGEVLHQARVQELREAKCSRCPASWAGQASPFVQRW